MERRTKKGKEKEEDEEVEEKDEEGGERGEKKKEEGESRECVSRDLSHHDTNSPFSNLPLLRYSLIL